MTKIYARRGRRRQQSSVLTDMITALPVTPENLPQLLELNKMLLKVKELEHRDRKLGFKMAAGERKAKRQQDSSKPSGGMNEGWKRWKEQQDKQKEKQND